MDAALSLTKTSCFKKIHRGACCALRLRLPWKNTALELHKSLTPHGDKPGNRWDLFHDARSVRCPARPSLPALPTVITYEFNYAANSQILEKRPASRSAKNRWRRGVSRRKRRALWPGDTRCVSACICGCCIPAQVNGCCISTHVNGCCIPAPVRGCCIPAQVNGCCIPGRLFPSTQ